MGRGYVVRITPADVGQRVSVRFRIAAPAGGPSQSDVVGHLREWSDGRLLIERRDGRVATLREADLLAGKVLGPPPVRRSGGASGYTPPTTGRPGGGDACRER